MRVLTLTLCLLPLSALLLCAQESPFGATRTAVTVVTDKNPVAPHPYVQKVRLRRFEDRFNQLAQAVKDFSLAYNKSNGQAWPADKVAALRKAMVELQKIDPNFKPEIELKPDSNDQSAPAINRAPES